MDQQPTFDPTKPFKVIDEPKFDPSKESREVSLSDAVTRLTSKTPPAPIAARGTGFDPRNRAENTKMFKDNAPMIGAVAGTALTGGTGWPAIVAAAGGGAAGQAIKDTQWEMPLEQRIKNALIEGGGQGLLQGAAGVLGKLAEPLEQGAVNLWLKYAKPAESVMQRTGTMLRGGTVMEAKEQVARDALEAGIGTLRKGNLDTAHAGLRQLDTDLALAIESSSATIPKKKILDAIRIEREGIGVGSIERQEAQDALDKVAVQIRRLPPNIPVQDAQKIKQGIYAARNYVASSTDAAKAAASKTEGRILRREIAHVAPETSPINAAIERQIPVTSVIDKAVNRTGNANPVTASQMIAGAVTNKATTAAAILNHPMGGSFIAQRLHDLSQMLPAAERTLPNLLRVLAHSLGGDEP